ncbi:diguanylate cyclase [Xanthomonas hortorum pv. pelargonii]|uniref:histidine kinase n=2 Tax=Xanthomonas hortorum TaxID=56454 RepID=A0A6V7CCL5_9XANT|nr:diguanylate cyclase [Xanthomonas hortorum]MCE4356296.1 diguanylate cyclase [Xanthomonas hortorum pv. pelargonii]NMI24241.1 diguanylate cyclase [Xanthomonas hortorum pv. pelargonii]WCI06031.1 diguanylate cyclase [Xanthomonas hortorum pv. pelargonii]CAD0313209.1 Sensor histidine kinase RcsC [Xanthomonas hortorum pv. pelargonii]CAD0313213.1 Sensor histidine kinase RcsC [Xanthomonas hortorum pv. pelargonii]
MEQPPRNAETDLTKRELSELWRQTRGVRLQLRHLRQDLAHLRHDLARLKNQLPSALRTDLQAANEQLLLSSLLAHSKLDAHAHALREAAHNANRDPLTKLPNRALLFERLEQSIVAAQHQSTRIAVLFVDLNDFKRINDLFGHSTGDEFLRLAAQRLTAAAAPSGIVARYGGDEFVVLLDGVDSHDAAALITSQLVQSLDTPCLVGKHELHLGASIGISMYPDDGETGMALLQHADDAMYCAKRNVAARFMFYRDCIALDLSHSSPAPAPAVAVPATADPQQLVDDPHDALREANSALILAALSAQQLHAAAEQGVQRQSEMLAFIAHELRNPLSPILAASSLLNSSPTVELPWIRQIIDYEVHHMNRLIGDLLDLSRVRTGKLRILKEHFSLHDMVEATVAACVPLMTARGQSFELRLPPQPTMLRGDSVRLSQVVRNLLDNASKYTPEGGSINLHLSVQARRAVIVVTDNGIGISNDALQRIFEPFMQDSRAIGFNGAGLGIGLAVVRQIIEAHGGSVVASSAGVVGLGCTFTLSLPLG